MKKMGEQAAWEAFCDALKRVGSDVIAGQTLDHEIDRAESLRYLTQQVARSVEEVLVPEDRALPLLRPVSTNTDKWAWDDADARYLHARIRGDGSYRLSGRLGNATHFSVQLAVYYPEYQAFASIDRAALQPAPDGSFELRISAERPAQGDGPWLACDPRTTHLLVRECFSNWQVEGPSELRIERLDPVPAVAPSTSAHSAALLGEMEAVFAQRAAMWTPRAEVLRERLVNRVSKPRGDAAAGLHGSYYGSGWFRIGPDEALVIELDAPEAQIWGFQLGTFWTESCDFVSRTGSVNGHQAVADRDGRYHIVIALDDPGVPNWLDPAGHPEGVILYRYREATNCPVPQLHLLPLAELRDRLPADTPHVGSRERAEAIAERRAHAARRWAS